MALGPDGWIITARDTRRHQSAPRPTLVFYVASNANSPAMASRRKLREQHVFDKLLTQRSDPRNGHWRRGGH